jgi:hypothetical protein
VPAAGKPLRILFFVDRPGVLRQFSLLVRELAERGHDVRVALAEEPDAKAQELVRQLLGEEIVVEQAPERAPHDGWRRVAWFVRALGDLARYAHPRYATATRLRERAADETLGRLESNGALDPLTRAFVLPRLRRLAGPVDEALSARYVALSRRLERAIPPSGRVVRFVHGRKPDVVLVASIVKLASPQVEYLKAARRLGIPVGSVVASWDNLTNKGLHKLVPERLFVWNGVMRAEAIELHGLPADRVVVTGAHRFDPWFGRSPSVSRAELAERAGLDPERPYVLFLGSSPFVTNDGRDEPQFVRRWIRALRESGVPRLERIGVLVRPHPVGDAWRGVELDAGDNAVVWPRSSRRPVGEDDQNAFFDSLAHSAAVVGVNTTAMIEAAIGGKSVLTVLAPEFAQESTLHFHYLLVANGGFLHVASSLDEHARQLASVLDEDETGVATRRAFVESFVRPHGLDRPATPIYADAVEELATLDAQPLEAYSRLLRALLALEAAYNTVVLTAGRLVRR